MYYDRAMIGRGVRGEKRRHPLGMLLGSVENPAEGSAAQLMDILLSRGEVSAVPAGCCVKCQVTSGRLMRCVWVSWLSGCLGVCRRHGVTLV